LRTATAAAARSAADPAANGATKTINSAGSCALLKTISAGTRISPTRIAGQRPMTNPTPTVAAATEATPRVVPNGSHASAPATKQPTIT